MVFVWRKSVLRLLFCVLWFHFDIHRCFGAMKLRDIMGKLVIWCPGYINYALPLNRCCVWVLTRNYRRVNVPRLHLGFIKPPVGQHRAFHLAHVCSWYCTWGVETTSGYPVWNSMSYVHVCTHIFSLCSVTVNIISHIILSAKSTLCLCCIVLIYVSTLI